MNSPVQHAMILGLLQNSNDIVAQILDASGEHSLNGPDPQPGHGVHHTQALLLGGAANGHPSRADLVENALALYLQNTFPLADVTVDHIDAVWGVYGILPLAVVSTPDAYLLVDTTNGQVAGPFEPGSNFYADDLLALHTNVFDSASTKPVYLNRRGCEWQSPPIASVQPGYPPAPYQPQPVPSGPTPGFTIPGNPSIWTCVTKGTGTLATCECTATSTYTLPPSTPAPPGYSSPTITVRTKCTYIGACDNPGTIPPSNITPPNDQCPNNPPSNVPPPTSPGSPIHEHDKP